MTSPNQKKTRAILLFTRSPETEARHKRLAGRLSFAERVGLYASFTRHVMQHAEAVGYPILVATDETDHDFSRYSCNIVTVFSQRGDDFGSKLAHALKDAFAQGYDEIVCIGNDCPELSEVDLQAAFTQLAQCEVTLGAARDGGVYLIGMRRPSLESVLRAVQECHWQTAMVLSDLLASAQHYAITVTVMRERSDVDTANSLMSASCSLPGLAFLERFINLLLHIPVLSLSTRFTFTPTSHYDPLRFQKAPPVFLR